MESTERRKTVATTKRERVRTKPARKRGETIDRSAADRLIAEVARPVGKPLSPLEQARRFRALRNMGLSETEIAARSMTARSRVVELLRLEAVQGPLMDLVEGGAISSTFAAKMIRQHHGDVQAAAASIMPAITEAQASGAKRVLPKHLNVTSPAMIARRLRAALDASKIVERKGVVQITMPAALYLDVIEVITQN